MKPYQPLEHRSPQWDALPPRTGAELFTREHPSKKPLLIWTGEAVKAGVHLKKYAFRQMTFSRRDLFESRCHPIAQVERCQVIMFGPRIDVVPRQRRIVLESLNVGGPARNEIGKRGSVPSTLDDRACLERSDLFGVQPSKESS